MGVVSESGAVVTHFRLTGSEKEKQLVINVYDNIPPNVSSVTQESHFVA